MHILKPFWSWAILGMFGSELSCFIKTFRGRRGNTVATIMVDNMLISMSSDSD